MKIRLLFLIFSLYCSAQLGAQTVILDFEAEATSTSFTYFGSDLDQTPNNIIANPDPSGINTSSMVGDHMKPAGGTTMTWAGCFADPVTMPISVIGGNDVCMKVWFTNPGNVAMKLENGTSPNWIQTQQVTETGMWTEICFDTNGDSEEDPFGPAAGGVFDQLTLFFDFGTIPSEDQTYYFDDVIVGESSLAPADITFAVDMNNYTGTYTNVFVSGTFNDWAGDAELMSDDDGDGIFTATVTDVAPGLQEYKFQVDEWADSESFNGNYTCTVTDPSGQFTNRLVVVGADEVLDPVCWGSCFGCGEAVLITVNLGAAAIDVDSSGLYIAGGTQFGVPGDNQLLDADGDGVYSTSFEKEVGFESFYTFTNGACSSDWSCKEDISGQACADPDNFNDRKMGPVMEDLVINTCFGVCTEDTDCEDGGMSDIAFSVDMNSYTGSYTTVFVTGNFVDWSGDALPMTDTDGDGIFTTTVSLLPGSYEYKFELDNWTVQEEFTGGEPCTITDASGVFTNRALEVGNGDMDVCFVWNTCDECEAGSSPMVTFNVDMNNYAGEFTTAYVAGSFVDWNGTALPMSDDDLDGIYTVTVELAPGDYEYKFELDDWAVSEQFTDGDPCTITDPSGQFVNRALTVGDMDMDFCFIWETCTACGDVGVSDVNATDDLFKLSPTVVQSFTRIEFNSSYNNAKEIILFSSIGQIAKIITVPAGIIEYALEVEDLDSGLYYINIQTEGVQQTSKFIVR